MVTSITSGRLVVFKKIVWVGIKPKHEKKCRLVASHDDIGNRSIRCQDFQIFYVSRQYFCVFPFTDNKGKASTSVFKIFAVLFLLVGLLIIGYLYFDKQITWDSLTLGK